MIKGMNKARTSNPWKEVRQTMVVVKHQSKRWKDNTTKLRRLVMRRKEIEVIGKELGMEMKRLFYIPEDDGDCD